MFDGRRRTSIPAEWQRGTPYSGPGTILVIGQHQPRLTPHSLDVFDSASMNYWKLSKDSPAQPQQDPVGCRKLEVFNQSLAATKTWAVLKLAVGLMPLAAWCRLALALIYHTIKLR